MTLILFTTQAPDPLAEELSQQGHIVHEAIAISEVLALAEQHTNASIVIAAGVDHERAKMIQQHYPTMHLKATASVKDILWELSVQLGKGQEIQ
jgi:hypothetical protein